MEILWNQAGMARKYCRLFWKVILVLENLSEAHFWTSKLIFQFSNSINWKFRIEVQNFTFEGCFQTKMTFRNILEYSQGIPASFSIRCILFWMKICENNSNQWKSMGWAAMVRSGQNIPRHHRHLWCSWWDWRRQIRLVLIKDMFWSPKMNFWVLFRDENDF